MAIDIKSIAIIGCGWLGLPLAQMLIKEGYSVKGSTRSVDKKKMLSERGIDAFVLDIYDEANQDYMDLGDVDVAVINIPPGRRVQNVETSYPSGISRLLMTCSGIRDVYVIFVSSTGVYPNSNALATESSIQDPVKASGRALVRAEKQVQRLCTRHVILRMAGLVGPRREPGRWFTGKPDLPGGDTPVNMVHQLDCINIIKLMINQQPRVAIYNVVAPHHPTKRDFYDAQSQKIGVDPPVFREGILPHKIVDHRKLVLDYSYEYNYPDPLYF